MAKQDRSALKSGADGNFQRSNEQYAKQSDVWSYVYHILDSLASLKDASTFEAVQTFSAGLKNTDTTSKTLSGDQTLASDAAQKQIIDPGGAARTITLPAEEDGLEFYIANNADAAEDLTVENDANTTIATVSQNEVGHFWSDGTSWAGSAAAGGVV